MNDWRFTENLEHDFLDSQPSRQQNQMLWTLYSLLLYFFFIANCAIYFVGEYFSSLLRRSSGEQFELKCQVKASCSSIQKIFIRSLARSFPLSKLLVTCFVSCPSEGMMRAREQKKNAEILVLVGGGTTNWGSWNRMNKAVCESGYQTWKAMRRSRARKKGSLIVKPINTFMFRTGCARVGWRCCPAYVARPPLSINNTWTFQMWPNIVFCKAVGIYFYFYRIYVRRGEWMIFIERAPKWLVIKLKFPLENESAAEFKENLLGYWIPRHNKPDAPIDSRVQLLKPFLCFTIERNPWH